MRSRADELNRLNILELIEPAPGERLLDLGCDDGAWSVRLRNGCDSLRLYGLDVSTDRLALANRAGIHPVAADLSRGLPFPSNSFDIVHANQVIEHLPDLDGFVSEIHRVLRPGGRTIISTENLASWCNVGSLVLGWQPFSATNVSTERLGLGNPFAINRGHKPERASWLHVHVLAYRALVELLENHGLRVERVLGAGYFPFPARLGRLDPRHAHFLAIRARKG